MSIVFRFWWRLWIPKCEFSLVEFYAETQNGITTLNTKTLDGNSFPIDTKINIQLIMDGEIRNSFGLIEESIVINN